MKTIYTTQEWKGYGKSYYHNEYRQDGGVVSQIKCGRMKFFDGKENTWDHSEHVTATWKKGDNSMPDWLKKYIK